VIVDTHCHLDDLRYSDDLEHVIARAAEEGVKKFIIPGADPATLERAVSIAQTYPNVYFAVGVHPYDAAVYDRKVLEPYAAHPKCVAIGECGLDYFRLPEEESEVAAYKQRQKEVFVDQIEWAKALDKPLIVHIRDASADALALLQRHASPKGGVLHCYNADESLLKLSDKNFYYGIGGVLTFKNARKLINVFPKIPHDRLLLETDAPYLTPHPHRGKRNEPAYCKLVAQKMCELSTLGCKEIEALTTANAEALFGI